MAKKIGIYPGSFDPFHNGHIYVIERAMRLFDEVHILVAVNPEKKYFFMDEQRMPIVQSFVERKGYSKYICVLQ
jgi:pantetheine-phosphate adenylyltransferase